jgi:hypothetical protein
LLALCESAVWGTSHHEEDLEEHLEEGLLGVVDLYRFFLSSRREASPPSSRAADGLAFTP